MSTLSMLKTRASVYVSTLALALVCSALPAQMPAARTRVAVPFAFQIGSTHFAPGTYVLSNPEEDLLYVQGGKHSGFAISMHESTRTPSRISGVVFHHYGNQYFLREVWTRGDTDYLTCPQSKAEQQARRSQHGDEHASVSDPTSVEIAALESPR